MADKKLAKHLRMTPEVTKIFDDLEEYLDYCKDNMLRYDERDLYNNKSEQWRKFDKQRQFALRQNQRDHA